MKPPTAQAITSGTDFDFPEPRELLAVLVPTPVTPYCYLYEALLWVAIQRHPLFSQWEHGDVRLDTEDLDDINPRMEFEPFSDDECDRAGLPHDPEYAAWTEGDGPPSDPALLKRLADSVADEKTRLELLSELPRAEAYAANLSAWEEQCDAFLDAPKSKLFLALREGKLAAYGKRISKQIAESFPEPLSHEEWHKWTLEPWQVISPNHWRSSGIQWEMCRANGTIADFALVLVSTEQLITAFPPMAERAGDVVRVGDGYQFLGTTAISRSSSRRGRPPYDWDAFHLEMAKRCKNGDLPTKQEALIAEMQAWCLAAWGSSVGRSTLLEKIRPYYNAFVRTSENGKG